LKELLRTTKKYANIKSLQAGKQDLSYTRAAPTDERIYRVTHTIITPKKHCNKKEIIEPNVLEIQYAPL
jgi:hypothetical protein